MYSTACKKYELIAPTKEINFVKGASPYAFTKTQKIIGIRKESALDELVQKEFLDLKGFSTASSAQASAHAYTTLPTVQIENKTIKASIGGILEETTENITQKHQNPVEVFSDIPVNEKEKIVRIISTNGNKQYLNSANEIVDNYTSTQNVNYKTLIDSTWYFLKNPKQLGKQKMKELEQNGYKTEWILANTVHHRERSKSNAVKHNGRIISSEAKLLKAEKYFPETNRKHIAYFYPDKMLNEKMGVFYTNDKLDYFVEFFYRLGKDSTINYAGYESLTPQERADGNNSVIIRNEIVQEDDTKIFDK